MAQDDNDEQYIFLEARLASFSGPQPVKAKRRTSTASSRGGKGVLSWPHKQLKPAEVRIYFTSILKTDRPNADCTCYSSPKPASTFIHVEVVQTMSVVSSATKSLTVGKRMIAPFWNI